MNEESHMQVGKIVFDTGKEITNPVDIANFFSKANKLEFKCQKCAEKDNELKKTKDNLQNARNILAVIHCDGGHYTEDNGYEKSSNDAITLFLALRSQFNKMMESLDQLLFCASRVKSATFRAIDRKQFDEAVDRADRTMIDFEKGKNE